MRTTWDPAKNAANIRKQGIAFARAVRIFEGPTLERIDDRYDYGETRIRAIGLVEDIEVFVVFAEKSGGERRIISARRAEPKERAEYRRYIAATYR